jgi:hypothetical protein
MHERLPPDLPRSRQRAECPGSSCSDRRTRAARGCSNGYLRRAVLLVAIPKTPRPRQRRRASLDVQRPAAPGAPSVRPATATLGGSNSSRQAMRKAANFSPNSPSDAPAKRWKPARISLPNLTAKCLPTSAAMRRGRQPNTYSGDTYRLLLPQSAQPRDGTRSTRSCRDPHLVSSVLGRWAAGGLHHRISRQHLFSRVTALRAQSTVPLSL